LGEKEGEFNAQMQQKEEEKQHLKAHVKKWKIGREDEWIGHAQTID
jgi:hypothetical protein